MCIRADFDFAYGDWFRDLKANSVELNVGFGLQVLIILLWMKIYWSHRGACAGGGGVPKGLIHYVVWREEEKRVSESSNDYFK